MSGGCEECGKPSPDLRHRKRHRQPIPVAAVRGTLKVCDDCPKKGAWRGKRELARHHANKHGTLQFDEITYNRKSISRKCDTCGITLFTKGTLASHMKKAHMKKMEIRKNGNVKKKCDICGLLLRSDKAFLHWLQNHKHKYQGGEKARRTKKVTFNECIEVRYFPATKSYKKFL